MSYQMGTDDKSKVGELVQVLLNESEFDDFTKIYVHCSDGHWYVTRDHK